VGKTGAGVPSPWIANRRKESNKTRTAATTRRPPTTRRGNHPITGVSKRHREIHQGTRPATVPGASTKKSVDPRTANTRLIRIFSLRRANRRADHLQGQLVQPVQRGDEDLLQTGRSANRRPRSAEMESVCRKRPRESTSTFGRTPANSTQTEKGTSPIIRQNGTFPLFLSMGPSVSTSTDWEQFHGLHDATLPHSDSIDPKSVTSQTAVTTYATQS
jgi:hypothetical protein